jgi:hypothetical protein
MLQAKELALIPCSIVFTFKLTVESIKELKGVSKTLKTHKISNLKIVVPQYQFIMVINTTQTN